MQVLNKDEKLKKLDEDLKRYKDILAQKMKNFHGVKHESALSELKYSEVMVYKGMVESLEKEIRDLKTKNGDN